MQPLPVKYSAEIAAMVGQSTYNPVSVLTIDNATMLLPAVMARAFGCGVGSQYIPIPAARIQTIIDFIDLEITDATITFVTARDLARFPGLLAHLQAHGLVSTVACTSAQRLYEQAATASRLYYGAATKYLIVGGRAIALAPVDVPASTPATADTPAPTTALTDTPVSVLSSTAV